MQHQSRSGLRWLPACCLGLGLLSAGCGSPLSPQPLSTQAVPAMSTSAIGQGCGCASTASGVSDRSQACRCACSCRPAGESSDVAPISIERPSQATVTSSAHDINEANALSRAAVEAARDGKYDQAIGYLQLAKAKLVSVDLGQLTSAQRTEVVQLLDRIDQALARVATAG